MSRQEQKSCGELSTEQGPTDEEYDLYLFWPSLSGQDVAGDTPSSPLYGVRYYTTYTERGSRTDCTSATARVTTIGVDVRLH